MARDNDMWCHFLHHAGVSDADECESRAAELRDSGAVGKFWKPSAKITTGARCQSMPLYVKKAHKRQIHWSVD